METKPSVGSPLTAPVGEKTTERIRKRKSRDLSKAITLRPADVFQLYGIPTSTLCQFCNNPDSTRRLPSRLIPGRKGRRGLRLIQHAELKVWLDRWKV